jgi:hypothetical protein
MLKLFELKQFSLKEKVVTVHRYKGRAERTPHKKEPGLFPEQKGGWNGGELGTELWGTWSGRQVAVPTGNCRFCSKWNRKPLIILKPGSDMTQFTFFKVARWLLWEQERRVVEMRPEAGRTVQARSGLGYSGGRGKRESNKFKYRA